MIARLIICLTLLLQACSSKYVDQVKNDFYILNVDYQIEIENELLMFYDIDFKYNALGNNDLCCKIRTVIYKGKEFEFHSKTKLEEDGIFEICYDKSNKISDYHFSNYSNDDINSERIISREVKLKKLLSHHKVKSEYLQQVNNLRFSN
jgi:hypothetical protein